MKFIRCIAVAMAVTVLNVFGEATSAKISTVETPAKGAWCKDLDATVGASKEDNAPVIVFWASSGSCDYCKAMRYAVNTREFISWQKSYDGYMCYGTGSDIKGFAMTGTQTLSGWPFICVYLPWANLKVNFTGRDGAMYAGTPGSSLAAQLIASVEAILRDYPPYMGGEFVAGETVGDRLEAQVGYTTEVTVPLTRSCELESYNVVVAEFPDGSTQSREFTWAQGQIAAEVSFDIDKAGGYEAGDVIALTSFDKNRIISRTATITFVDRENSPKNPTWRGVSGFGEWTMDIAAAQDFVKGWKQTHPGQKAYVLALLGGSMWCPDCARTDAYLIDTPEFRDWASEKHVACVSVDIPNWSASAPETGPCLLTREKKAVSQTYVDADPDHGSVQSGAGYLSRWMISDADAAARLAANKALVGRNTLDGGWNRPERANQYRTGVPVFVLLNDDGTIAGRIETFASQSPGAFMPGYIDRLDELLATADGSEDNVHWKTTEDVLAVDGAAARGVVSGGDLVNVYRLSDVDFAKRTTVSVSGAAPSGLGLKVTLFQVDEDGAETVYAGDSADFEAFRGDCYARIELTGLEADAGAEKFGRSGDATTAYGVSATSAAVPGEVAFVSPSQEVFVPDGVGSVSVVRRDGRTGEVSVKVCVSDAGSAEGFYDFTETTLTWASGETGEKTVFFDVFRTDTIASGSFELSLVEVGSSEAQVSSGSHVVTLTDTDKPCFATFENEVSSFSGFASAGLFELKNVDPAKPVTIRKVDGSLPSGLRLAYNKKSGMVELSGTAKKSGTYTFSYTVRQGGETGLPATFTVVVENPADYNPFVGVKRTAQDVPLVGAVGGTNVLMGVLNVTVSARNQVKAKFYGTGKKTVSYAGAWQSVDRGTGEASALLVARDGSALAIAMDGDGKVSASVAAAGQAGELAGSADWPETDFGAWEGSYTLTFPDLDENASGTAFGTMTVSAKGAVRWNAVLSDGTSLSGKGALVNRKGDKAQAVVFKRGSKRGFGALVEIASDGCVRWNKSTGDGYAPQLLRNVAGLAAWEFSGDGEAESLRASFGSWYKPNITTVELAETFGYENGFLLGLEGFGTVGLEATSKGFASESSDVKIKFTKKTGAFSGTAKLKLADGRQVKATYKGVLMPGWDECSACQEGIEVYERPFGSGTMYYKDTVGGIKVTVSVPVDIEFAKLSEE